jgi:hypothetical protein
MSKDNIYTALLRFSRLVGIVTKDATNPFHQNKYADLSTIQRTVEPHLAETGLLIFHLMGEGDTMSTVVLHAESGTELRSTYNLHCSGDKSQDWGSAITYAKRYALGCMLNLCIDVDDDGNKSSGYSNQRQPSAPPAEPVRRPVRNPTPPPPPAQHVASIGEPRTEVETAVDDSWGGMPEHVRPYMDNRSGDPPSVLVRSEEEKQAGDNRGWIDQRKTPDAWAAAKWLVQQQYSMRDLRTHWKISTAAANMLEDSQVPF